MKSSWLGLFVIFFFAVIVILFFGFWIRSPLQNTSSQKESQTTENGPQEKKEPTVTFLNPKKGASESEIVIVEFGDFLCHACKELQETLDAVLRSDPSLQLVWKYMPNEQQDALAVPASIAAHCAADQGKFWEYHDLLFERQVYVSEDQLFQIAQETGLSMDTFKNCYNNKDSLPFIRKDYEEGLELGITALPTIFLGTERFVGVIDSQELLSQIQKIRNTKAP